MRIKIDHNPDTAMFYNPPKNIIYMNPAHYIRLFPDCWIRKMMAGFVHELVHWTWCRVNDFMKDTPLDIYKQELIAYRIQSWMEDLLIGESEWGNDIELGAALSTAFYLHNLYHISRRQGRKSIWENSNHSGKTVKGL